MKRHDKTAVLLGLAWALLAAFPGWAASPFSGPAASASTVAPAVAEPSGVRPATEIEQAREYFGDTALVDQEGRSLRLYSDLMADRVVVIAAMFTTCEGVCPVTMANFKQLQDWLGPRLGDDVLLLAVSVDPEQDTPERLAEYARAFGAREGWHFLTGERVDVDSVLRRLGLYAEVKESHSPVFLVGNERTGLWKKAMGLAGAEALTGIVETVLRDRRPGDDAAVIAGADR